MHRDMRFAMHTGEGGANVSAPRAPETLAARAASGPGGSLEGRRGSPHPAVQEAAGGAGAYPGLLPRRRLGPRAGRRRERSARLALLPL